MKELLKLKIIKDHYLDIQSKIINLSQEYLLVL